MREFSPDLRIKRMDDEGNAGALGTLVVFFLSAVRPVPQEGDEKG